MDGGNTSYVKFTNVGLDLSSDGALICFDMAVPCNDLNLLANSDQSIFQVGAARGSLSRNSAPADHPPPHLPVQC